MMGHCGGKAVSMDAFYSNKPGSSLYEVYNFFCEILFLKEQKETGFGSIFQQKRRDTRVENTQKERKKERKKERNGPMNEETV